MRDAFFTTNPQVSTLRSQTASILKEAILGGKWQSVLPPEAELCSLLKVGRNTVRAALKDLASQNLIIPGGNGRNHRIAAPSTLVKKAAKKAKLSRVIRYLSNEAFHELGELTTLIYRSAETKLAARGYKLFLNMSQGFTSASAEAR